MNMDIVDSFRLRWDMNKNWGSEEETKGRVRDNEAMKGETDTLG